MVEFREEVEADFLTFYRVFDIEDEPKLDGPRLLRLASQLPRYAGAVRSRLEYEMQSDQKEAAMREEGLSIRQQQQFEPGQTMSMAEAVARSRGDEMAVLNSLSKDSQNAGMGDLFEYETG